MTKHIVRNQETLCGLHYPVPSVYLSMGLWWGEGSELPRKALLVSPKNEF